MMPPVLNPYSSYGEHPVYVEAAKALGAAITQRGDELVYGGGRVGLMGTVAAAGAHVESTQHASSGKRSDAGD